MTQAPIEPPPPEARAATHRANRLDFVARAGEQRAAVVRQTLLDTENDLADTIARLADTQARLSQTLADLAARDHLVAQLRLVEQAYLTVTRSTLWRAMSPLRRALGHVPRPLLAAARPAIARLARLVLPSNPPPPAIEPPPVPDARPPAPSEPVPRPALADIAPPRTGFLPLIDCYDPIAPDVSIVLYNRNAGQAAPLALQHLWQHTTGHRYEIILVDDGSAPAELAHLRADATFARFIPLGGRRYVGEANNIGVEAASGRYVCLLDSASFVTPGWLEPLVSALETGNTGAVGPTLILPDGSPLVSAWSIDPAGQLSPATAHSIDTLSPSCLLLRRADFLRVQGFDLAWEPGSYETADLCLKLRLLGRRSVVCPATTVLRTAPDAWPDGVSADVVALNRGKFLDRWGPALATAWQQTPPLPPEPTPPHPRPGPRPRVLIYTPYQLTPGGGERYILTIAQALQPVADVTLVTAYRVSRTRLHTMAREFELDLAGVDLVERADAPPADLAFVLGNELLPSVPALAPRTFYICQFPFPFENEAARTARLPFWQPIDRVLTYSDYARSHVLRQMTEAGLPPRPIDVLTPPVPMVTRRAPKRRGQILNVGRFFVGGHCKRQDAMIDAFRSLIEAGVAAELHFAGSTMPEPVHQAYYAGLIEAAHGLPITFHPNCSPAELHRLYAESDLYWHASGVGRDIDRQPHVVEHFGIAVVEAMSARCVPIVFAAGGPPGIVQDGIAGFHFRTLDDLAATTRRLLESTSTADLDALRAAAERAAQTHTEAKFTHAVLEIAARTGGIATTPLPAILEARPLP